MLPTKNLVCEYYDICENKIFVYCKLKKLPYLLCASERKKKTKGKFVNITLKKVWMHFMYHIYIYIPKNTHQSPESSRIHRIAPAHLKARSDEEIETAPRSCRSIETARGASLKTSRWFGKEPLLSILNFIYLAFLVPVSCLQPINRFRILDSIIIFQFLHMFFILTTIAWRLPVNNKGSVWHKANHSASRDERAYGRACHGVEAIGTSYNGVVKCN